MTGENADGPREVKRTLWVEDGKIRLLVGFADGTRAIKMHASDLVEIEFGEDGRIDSWSETFEEGLVTEAGSLKRQGT